MNEAFIILGFIVMVQTGIIYGLINRIMKQNGLPGMNVTQAIEKSKSLFRQKPENEKVEKKRVISGTQRITP